MGYERRLFTNEAAYHVYNRGVAKQPIFENDRDRQRFLDTFSFYLDDEFPRRLSQLSAEAFRDILSRPPQQPLVEILAYCLMPNHFHFLLRQVADGGITTFMRRATLSYVHYFNTKYHRVGPLFQGPYQVVTVAKNDQLLHVSRYQHLNPVVARLYKEPTSYPWSSMSNYLSGQPSRLCQPELILALAGSSERYQEFVCDYADYAIALHDYKDLLLDPLD